MFTILCRDIEVLTPHTCLGFQSDPLSGGQKWSWSGPFSLGLFLQFSRLQYQTECIAVIYKHKGRSIFIKVCQTQSADLSVFVLFFLFFYYSFLFFSTATCVLRFLHYFSTNLDEIWHVDSPWWDEQTEYFFKSIGPGVGIRRGPIVLLCFIIRKTLYTVRRDKNFT